MDKVRLGIIGIGNMGSGHLKNILEGKVPEMEVTAVADRQEGRRTWAKEHLPESVAVFEEGKDLITAGVCDGVLIAVPHYQHPELTIDAMNTGCM